MQSLPVGVLPLLPPVGGATEQGSRSIAWRLEQVVFREDQAALVIRLHDSGIQEPLPPALIRLADRGGCVSTANRTGKYDEALCCVEPLRFHSVEAVN